MDQEEEFFSDVKEWSARKLSIIKKYVDGFRKSLGEDIRKSIT